MRPKSRAKKRAPEMTNDNTNGPMNDFTLTLLKNIYSIIKPYKNQRKNTRIATVTKVKIAGPAMPPCDPFSLSLIIKPRLKLLSQIN